MSQTQKIVSSALVALVIAVSLLTILQTQAVFAAPPGCRLVKYTETCNHWCWPPWQGKFHYAWYYDCSPNGTYEEHQYTNCGACG
ncbi:MAG: hypothetical protein CVU38_03725 [Chloroflexi bacterium HGW-Chloroflexi-1]|nr:MAG: hypothetical protein CVU38_03725 [Chloroflexi bacterium HGW-Chloroflexi-1]